MDGPIPWDELQDHQFGSSPFLQTTDWTAPAAYPNFAIKHVSTATTLTFLLTPAATEGLAVTGKNQFRIGLTVDTFTNRNGAGSD